MPATFATDQTEAESQRQTAYRQAQAAFQAERARIGAAYTAAYEKARDAFDRVKSDPSHKGIEAAAAEFHRIAGLPANYRGAHAALDQAMQAADSEYQAAMSKARHAQLARERAAIAPNKPIR
jgi:hypothetical protein